MQTRVLVVDERTVAEQTVTTLDTAGHEVTVASTVSDALVAVREQRPDVVVTEYRLPDDDGLALLREIRDRRESLPVIVYTAHGGERVASECIDAGVSAYVPKDGETPTEHLLERVEELARRPSSDSDVPSPTPDNIIRAVDDAPIGITLSDPSLPDNPLVYVNDGYEVMTGYDAETVLGRNCRFLQGPDTSEEPVRQMRKAIDNEEPVSVEVLNYHEDGTPFWNNVTVAPIRDDDDELVHFVGFQEDITDRKEAEASARRRAEALREERETLERVLGRVSGLVNDISQTLVGTSSREEVEREVCTQIISTDGYSHAWIGEQQPAGSAVTVRASESTQQQVVETKMEFAGSAFEETIEQGTVSVPAADADLPSAVSPERFDAAAMAVVPLTYRRTAYGVLCVYADRSEVLDRRECEVLEAVGQMVASGINAVETKKVLTADRISELGVEITDDSFPLVELATRAEASISYDGSTVGEGGTLRLFVTFSEPLAEFEEHVAACSGIVDGFVVARTDETVAASLELADQPFAELAEYGASLRDLSASDTSGTSQVHIELPVEGDTRSVLSVFESAYNGVNLVRQREREREPRPNAEFSRAVAERLTDRQYTALETAYLSNYFEFPRPVSGEDLAETMDISRQTYHQHLRAAQRKLLEELFESR